MTSCTMMKMERTIMQKDLVAHLAPVQLDRVTMNCMEMSSPEVLIPGHLEKQSGQVHLCQAQVTT